MMIVRLTSDDGRMRVVDASGMEIVKDACEHWTIGQDVTVDREGFVSGATNALVFDEALQFVEVLGPYGVWACFDA